MFQVSEHLFFNSYGYIFLEGELHSNSVFWGITKFFFHSNCTILLSHQQHKRVPVSPHFCQCVLFSFFFFFFPLALPVDLKLCLIVIFICTSLMTNDVEHLFMGLLNIWMSSLEKCLCKSFAQFLIALFVFLLLSCQSSLYIQHWTLIRNIIFKHLLPL